MGSIDGLPMAFGNRSILSGAAFRLSKPAETNFHFTSSNGSLCGLRDNGNWIVVDSFKGQNSVSAVLNQTIEDAQQTLDVVALTRREHLCIPSADIEHFVWRRTDQGIVSTLVKSIENNNSKILSSVALPSNNVSTWHVSMRYFRYSRIRNDLFVAYRDAFLALESILSYICPIANGEKEKVWYKRACDHIELQGIDFADITDRKTPSMTNDFVSEQYTANRCALFHAKSNNSLRVPGRLVDREKVSKALCRLETLLVRLFAKTFNASCSLPLLTTNHFKNRVERWLPVFLSVSEDSTPVSPTDLIVSPSGLIVSDLSTVFKGTAGHTGFEYTFQGVEKVAQMQTKIINTVAASDQESLITRGNIEQLDIRGSDIFQMRFTFSFSQPAVFPYHYDL